MYTFREWILRSWSRYIDLNPSGSVSTSSIPEELIDINSTATLVLPGFHKPYFVQIYYKLPRILVFRSCSDAISIHNCGMTTQSQLQESDFVPRAILNFIKTYPVSFCRTISFLRPPCLPYISLTPDTNVAQNFNIRIFHLPPPIDQVGRTGWQPFVSVTSVNLQFPWFICLSVWDSYWIVPGHFRAW